MRKKTAHIKEDFLKFLSAFVVIDINSELAIEASTIGVDLQFIGKTIDLHDLYIAATAKFLNVPLITNNIKHFEAIKDLSIIKWPELLAV